ncbi:hypothetical protein SB780_35935, partial [Burkholderia sp. SIMBA_057]
MATRVRETTLETGTGTKQKMGFSMRNDANSPDASNYIVAPAYENHAEFSLYLGRCQVDTPPDLVK